jgi:hypothetical protein
VLLRRAAYRFEDALQKKPATLTSPSSLDNIFPLVKPELNLLVGTSEQTLAVITLHYEMVAFEFDFSLLMGSLVQFHHLPSLPQHLIRCVLKRVR